MRIRPVLLAAVGLAACSAPKKTEPLATRDLTTVPVDTAVASDIEIGRPPKSRLPSIAPRHHVDRLAAALGKNEVAAPKLTVASVALIEPTHEFKTAPVPVEVLAAAPAPETPPTLGLGIDGSSHRTGPTGEAESSPRGWRGGVIIRGGMGGIDDDCDTRNPHRRPTAIHRLAPSFGGGIR